MQGRIIAIKVSDADFEILEGLKKGKGIGWNELLLAPVEAMYDITLESARPAKRKAERGKTEIEVPSDEAAERVEVEGLGTLIMPHTHKDKSGKPRRKKAEKQETSAAEAGPDMVIQETVTEG